MDGKRIRHAYIIVMGNLNRRFSLERQMDVDE
jgi:hypothetical protein